MKLIQNGRAEYVVHIEFPATCYRKIIETSETETEFRLNSSDIAKDIEISTFIVSTKAIINFHSDDFHPDYHGLTFNILSNQILSVGTHYDDTNQALDIIAEKAFPSNILLLSPNNFTSNKNLVLGIIYGIRERKQAGGKITRNHIVDAYKYFNCIGSITLLDMLSRNKVKNLTMNELDRLYGKVDI